MVCGGRCQPNGRLVDGIIKYNVCLYRNQDPKRSNSGPKGSIYIHGGSGWGVWWKRRI